MMYMSTKKKEWHELFYENNIYKSKASSTLDLYLMNKKIIIYSMLCFVGVNKCAWSVHIIKIVSYI
jgi:hypothetical protein